MPDLADPDLSAAISLFILEYRAAGAVPRKLMEAALAAFPTASSSDVARAIPVANRAERLAGGGK